MWAIVRFASDKSIHTFTVESVYDAQRLLTMDKVVWIQVITDTGMVIMPKVLDQSKLDKEAWSHPLRPNGAWMPRADINDENTYNEAMQAQFAPYEGKTDKLADWEFHLLNNSYDPDEDKLGENGHVAHRCCYQP